MADRRSDVLVLGAGPAGLVTAGLLARAGHQVTILESRAEPAPGVLCLSPPGAEILTELGVMARLEELPAAVRSGLLLLVGPHERVELCDDCGLLSVPRPEALAVMERSTCGHGATLIKGFTAYLPSWQHRGVVGVRARDGAGEQFVFEASVVVDATGARAFLPAALGQAMPRRGPRRVRAVARLEGAPATGTSLVAFDGQWLLMVPAAGGMVQAVLRVPDGVEPTPEWADERLRDALGVEAQAALGGARRVSEASVGRVSVGGVMRAVAGDGWAAVGAAAGCGGPGFPGATSAGLVVASSAAWEAHLALRDGKVFTGGSAGATVTLARQRVHLETLLERALSRAARVGMLSEAGSGRRRAAILTAMLEGRWAEAGGRLRRLLYLWWLDHRSRRLLGRGADDEFGRMAEETRS